MPTAQTAKGQRLAAEQKEWPKQTSQDTARGSCAAARRLLCQEAVPSVFWARSLIRAYLPVE